MRTNIVLDDRLVNEAFKYSNNIKTKKALIQAALEEYVSNRKKRKLSEIRGKINFRDDYNYKDMREIS